MPQAIQQRETISREIHAAVRHTAVYGLGSIVVKILGFLMLPFYTHYLSPADYGLLEILDLSMSLFGMVLHMGIAPALMRSYAAAGTAAEKSRTVSTAFLFVFGTGILTFVLGVGAVTKVSALLFGPKVSSVYLLLSFLAFVLNYLGAMPRAYLRAIEASGTFIVIDSGGLFVVLALNIYFIAVLKIGAMGILWSGVIVGGIQAVFLSIWLVRKVGIGFSSLRLREMAAFGFPLIFSNVSLFALNFSDRFFLQRLLSLEVVGVYAVGYKLAFMINYLLVQPFQSMWQARMYNIYAQDEHPKIFNQIFTLYSLLLIFAALAMSLFSPEIVDLMADPKFRDGKDVVPIVTFGYVFYGISTFVQAGLYLGNRTKAIGGIAAVAAVANLCLNYFLIRSFGMMGAAWATLIGCVIIAVGSYWFAQRVLPMPYAIGRVAAGLALAALLCFTCWRVAPESMLLAISLKCVALLAFPLLVCKLEILSPTELGTLVELSGRNRTTALITRRLGWVIGR
jgi:O-antigen/teichoic acid export membrane protein